MVQDKLFEPILDMLIESMPRDNLLNSACLEFFDFVKRENIKALIAHLVENYREKMKQITYVDIFSNFMTRYDQTSGFAPSVQTSFVDTEDDTPKRPERGSRWSSGIKDLSAAEEEYFNTSDDDEPPAVATSPRNKRIAPQPNGDSPASKRLVDYNSDEEMETDVSAGIVADESKTPESSTSKDSDPVVLTPTSSSAPSPPERLAEKRRREEDEDDDMSKLAQQPKRRNSTTSNSSNSSLKRKKSFTNGGGTKGNKIAISLSPAIKTGGEKGGEEGGT